MIEALSFSNTFKSPDTTEVEKRQEELLNSYIESIRYKTKLHDGTWMIEDTIYLSGKHLKTLKGLNVSKVIGNVYVHNNELTSLEGGPKDVSGDYLCYYNQLTSLKGAPIIVDGDFTCSANKLTSLEGGPVNVGGHFMCIQNKLTSLEGCPKKVGRDFDCYSNLKKFTEEDIKGKCKIGGRFTARF